MARIASRLLVGCSAVEPVACIRAFTADAARLILGEARLSGPSLDLEILYLANRFGFRIATIPVAAVSTPGEVNPFQDLWKIRRNAVEMKYRSPRRCPVCFYTEVRSVAQLPGNVVRYCARCRTTFLGMTPPLDELLGRAGRAGDNDQRPAAEKELAMLRRSLPARARVLEVGARDGALGERIAREFDYVGITTSDQQARAARLRGVEVLRASLIDFVNTGSPFDAALLLDVLQYIPEPHDALARVRDLLKPGGVLLLRTFDSESLSGTLAPQRWLRKRFRDAAIIYSRSALIELLERSGFEIASVAAAYESRRGTDPQGGGVARFRRFIPASIPVASGSIRVMAVRRAGPPYAARPIRAVEVTHAR